jgi:arginine-tRNA-protein transferase
MLTGETPFINEQFFADQVSSDQLDVLLAGGWRHFGTQFFKYSYGFYDLDVRRVIPLRIRLEDFSVSKSQRRVLRKNTDLETVIKSVEITAQVEALFEMHKQRFKSGVPESIYDFLSVEPSTTPCEGQEVAVYDDHHLLAVSYFDVGAMSNSGIYAMFDPDYADRSLGIFTMLKEIEHAIETGKQFYYQGYSYEGPSFYDYKKRFRGSEGFDWNGNWQKLGTGISDIESRETPWISS